MDRIDNSYHVEKMMQFERAEMETNIRRGLYVKASKAQNGEREKNAEAANRGIWHRWFGSRRLDTSWK